MPRTDFDDEDEQANSNSSDASYETHSENAVAHAQRAPIDEVARSAVHNAATNTAPPPAEPYASINKPSSELAIAATASSRQKNYRREGALDAENSGEAEEKAVRRSG